MLGLAWKQCVDGSRAAARVGNGGPAARQATTQSTSADEEGERVPAVLHFLSQYAMTDAET